MKLELSDTPKKGATGCSRFDSCNAPICLLSELVKDCGEARLRASMPSAQVDTLTNALPKIAAQWGAIRSRLMRASRTSSKLESAQRSQRLKKASRAGDATQPPAVAPDGPCVPRPDPFDGGSSGSEVAT